MQPSWRYLSYAALEKLVSRQRLFRYYKACRLNEQLAVELYYLNQKLSSALFIWISNFEIILRNRIDNHFREEFGPKWLQIAMYPGGFLRAKGTDNSFYMVEKKAQTFPKSELVARLSLSFWCNLFNIAEYNASGQTLHRIFIQKPKSSRDNQLNRQFIYDNLCQIKDLRNAIAHNEPVCFVGETHTVSINLANENYRRIKMFFQWLGVDTEGLMHPIDYMPALIEDLQTLIDTITNQRL